MTEFLKTLLLLSASGSVLGLLLTLARRVSGKRLPSTLWYYAWLPVLLRLVLPLPGLIPGAQASAETTLSALLMQAETSEKRSYRYNEYEEYYASGTKDEETDTSGVEAAAHIETVSEAETTEPTQPRIQPFSLLKSPELWLAVWLIGTLLCFTRYTVGYVRFRRVLMRTLHTTDGRTAQVYKALNGRSDPKLFASAYVKTPMLLGLRRPLIVLPQGEFPEEAARNVLRHELTHYRRGDLYVKWFFVLTASLHWFNPLMPLFRRELDRVCELSCDETVLARMEPSERRSYGETLLDLASNRALPAGVVATTFATEKRALKERLEQIMKFKYKPRTIAALTIAALLLTCTIALAAAPSRSVAASAGSPEPTPEAFDELAVEPVSVTIAGVDEFLSAIAPDTIIHLAPGTYDLSTASDYGKDTDSEYYRWEEVVDGYELVIENVEDLSIIADSEDVTATVISAVPRYADVLAFSDCWAVTLTGFTAGHTVEQGQCAGGVVHLMAADCVSVEGCALYGCGVLGIEAENCRNIVVRDSDIYECSNGAVWLTSCQNVLLVGCDFRDCYNRYGDGMNSAYRLFNIESCYGVAITDGHVYGNYAMELVHADYSQEVYLLGTLFENNTVDTEMSWDSGTILSVTGDPITVAGCEFRDDFPIYAVSDTSPAADLDGNALSNDDLAAMKQEHINFTGFAEMDIPELDRTQNADGTWEVRVSTVDEFLAAIAPDTTVYLDEGLYDLSEAANYGAYGSQYYYWVDMFDGPGLVISGVKNFSIIGADKDTTRMEALPRYVDVIRFDSCHNVSVHGITAGHTLGAGSCSGAVLDFIGCEGVDVRGCGLFGCGTYGVKAINSRDITVEENEIYECSYGAVQLNRCIDAVFADNDIHDCAYPTYGIYECLDVSIDGEAVEERDLNEFEDPIFAEYIRQEANEDSDPILTEIAEYGKTIHASIDIPGAGPYSNPNIQG